MKGILVFVAKTSGSFAISDGMTLMDFVRNYEVNSVMVVNGFLVHHGFSKNDREHVIFISDGGR